MMFFDVLERRQMLAAQYSLTLLAPATGTSSSHANAINESGKVVGYSGSGSGSVATQWSGSTATALPADPLGDKVANDINDSGTVLYDRYTRSSGGTFTKLFVPSNIPYVATHLNNIGDAAGTIDFLNQAVVWYSAKPDEYSTIDTGDDAIARDINDSGAVVGSVSSVDGTIPFIYSNKQIRPLPIPDSSNPNSEANAINNDGDVAGFISLADSGKTKHAVVWIGTLITSLPKLNGSDFSLATAINSSDDVVGYGDAPFLYHNGSMSDLNTLVNLPSGTTLKQALDINDKGQIVGWADTPSGPRGFILNKLGTATIAGTVYNDVDADGIKDSGEAALKGTKVFIDADKDGVLDTGEIVAITDSSGNFKFGSLAAGSYRIRQVPLSGYRATNPSTGYFDVTVSNGQNVTGKNFGNTQKVLITGTIWNDTNSDGVKGSTEKGVSGWRVFIDKDKDGVFDSGEPSVLTDSSGNYSFKTLSAGSYRVREVLPAGWRRTAPSAGYYDLTLSSGATTSNRNFGNTQNILITGSVFNDLDKDKVKDSTEKGLGSWRVYIDKDNDGVFDAGENSVLTTSSGSWTFKSLAAGTYVVRVVTQSGWSRTTPTGGSITITLGAGATASGKNFGFAKIG